jgi:hypothetical protein
MILEKFFFNYEHEREEELWNDNQHVAQKGLRLIFFTQIITSLVLVLDIGGANQKEGG